MNLEDFYRGRGEDYPVIIGRFMGNENLLKKFVKNFPDDPTYGRLCEAMEAKDWPQVEMSAHTLKGGSGESEFFKTISGIGGPGQRHKITRDREGRWIIFRSAESLQRGSTGNIRAGLNLGKEYGSRKADAFDR